MILETMKTENVLFGQFINLPTNPNNVIFVLGSTVCTAGTAVVVHIG